MQCAHAGKRRIHQRDERLPVRALCLCVYYPFVPLRGYLDAFLRVIASDTIAERVLFANAARLLHID